MSFHICHICTLLSKLLLKAFRPSSLRCKSKAMQTRAWLCFNLCAGNFEDNLALFRFTSSQPLYLHLRQLSQNAGDFNAKQRESVKSRATIGRREDEDTFAAEAEAGSEEPAGNNARDAEVFERGSCPRGGLRATDVSLS